jgi:hypothetical protein
LGLEWFSEWKQAETDSTFSFSPEYCATFESGRFAAFGQCYLCKELNLAGWDRRQLNLKHIHLTGKDNLIQRPMVCPKTAHQGLKKPVGVTALLIEQDTLEGSVEISVEASCFGCGKENCGKRPPRYFPCPGQPMVCLSAPCCEEPKIKMYELRATFSKKDAKVGFFHSQATE